LKGACYGGIIADGAGIQATWQFGKLLSLAVILRYLALRTCRDPLAQTAKARLEV